ncbi:unnamed protein product [Notodromas monacha]|uniref:Sodium-dependent nutrient amino acid transporter 1 n=1 Tax=Notodromas monacha TaxID=399045 RepID=A0A7R9BF63_9CRUS|nr:unnamed protein product [Notodromas monacha]CAG0913693.1 unnamed protein product [Notodromas monacha]
MDDSRRSYHDSVDSSLQRDDSVHRRSSVARVRGEERRREESSSSSRPTGALLESVTRFLVFTLGWSTLAKFPLLAYEYGLVPVLVMHLAVTLLCILPFLYLDMGIGQYCGKGPLRVFKAASPLFRGLGFTSCIAAWVSSLDNGMFVAWNLMYLLSSFTNELPWDYCDSRVGSFNCFSSRNEETCKRSGSTFYNGTCIPYEKFCAASGSANAKFAFNNTPGYCVEVRGNVTTTRRLVPVAHIGDRVLAAEDYFQRTILNSDASNRIRDGHPGNDTEFPQETSGKIHLPVFLATALAWAVFGIRIAFHWPARGLYLYFTCVVQLLVVLMLLLRLVSMPGFLAAARSSLTAQQAMLDWSLGSSSSALSIEHRRDPTPTIEAWIMVAQEAFLAHGIGTGVVMKLASFRPFNAKIHQTAVVVTAATLSISVIKSFVVVVGAGMAAALVGSAPWDVAAAPSSVIFLVTSYIIAHLPVPTLAAFVYFIFVTAAALETQVMLVDAAHVALFELWSPLKHYKKTVAFGFAAASFVASIPMTTRGGINWFLVMSDYPIGVPLMINAALYCTVFLLLHGPITLRNYFLSMKSDPSWVPSLAVATLAFVAFPVTLTTLLLSMIVDRPLACRLFNCPNWLRVIYWVIISLMLSPIPIFMGFAVYTVWKEYREESSDDGLKHSNAEDAAGAKCNFGSLLKPSIDWQPSRASKKRRVPRRRISADSSLSRRSTAESGFDSDASSAAPTSTPTPKRSVGTNTVPGRPAEKPDNTSPSREP